MTENDENNNKNNNNDSNLNFIDENEIENDTIQKNFNNLNNEINFDEIEKENENNNNNYLNNNNKNSYEIFNSIDLLEFKKKINSNTQIQIGDYIYDPNSFNLPSNSNSNKKNILSKMEKNIYLQ